MVPGLSAGVWLAIWIAGEHKGDMRERCEITACANRTFGWHKRGHSEIQHLDQGFHHLSTYARVWRHQRIRPQDHGRAYDLLLQGISHSCCI